ncbi:MAG: hypothetical protein GYB65_16860 [Chloroflexi bacterium]|nr:hypothetical protein [Chloroflexota bacterium]
MKPYTIEKLIDQPVIVLTVQKDYDVQRDMPTSRVDLVRILDTLDEPVFYVLDLSRLTVSFDDIMQGAALGARGEGASWHHPKLRDILWVTDEQVIKVAVEGLKSDAFGHLNIKLFGSVDDAVDYALDQV